MFFIDFLVFRVVDFSNEDLNKFLQFLDLSVGDFKVSKGRFYVRYNKMLSFNNVIYIYLSEEYNEALIKLTGEGLEFAYLRNSQTDRNITNPEFNIIHVFINYYKGRINFTRLDLAIDTDNEKVVNRVLTKIRLGEYTSVSKVRREVVSYKSNNYSGQTIYIGSPSSDRMLRIYDKAKEQGLDEFLYRFELQLKKDWANIVAFLIYEDRYNEVLSVFNDMLAIRERNGNDKNKSRWKVSQFWIDFLKTSLRRVVKLGRVKRSISNFVFYVRKNLKRRLKQAFTYDKELLYEVLGYMLNDFEELEVKQDLIYSSTDYFVDF